VSEENRRLQRRFVEEYQSGRDEAVAEAILADDFVNHAEVPGLPNGRDGVKLLHQAFWQAFPDFRAEIQDMVAEGDRVVTRKTLHGTHEGDFMGIPPTGKQVSWDVIDIVRYENGRLAEHWNVVDQLGLLRQLGVVRG
jgi:steroid delta-isomerase-like uncharacterized protein